MTPDDFDPARGYDNPPACLRCDARDQEIEALRQQVAQLREALAELLSDEHAEDTLRYFQGPLLRGVMAEGCRIGMRLLRADAALGATEGKR